MRTEEIIEMAKRMRLMALDMAYAAGKSGAHLGGALSAIEILATLYGDVARLDSKNPSWQDRDRILIGKAHCVLAYYTALYEKGYLTKEEIDSFEQVGSNLVGHPQKDIEHGMEYAGGSLGMALSVAAGMALCAKNEKSVRKVYVLLGDGECEEGSIWESMMFAGHYKLDNLVAIIDRNRLQSDGDTEDVLGLGKLARKIEAFDWKVVEADGHNVEELLEAYRTDSEGKPLVIIANTVKGKGVSFMENDFLWHHSELKEELYMQAKQEVECGGL